MNRRWRWALLLAVLLGAGSTSLVPSAYALEDAAKATAQAEGAAGQGHSHDGHGSDAEGNSVEAFPVHVNDDELFQLSLARDGKSPAERAGSISRALEEALGTPGSKVKTTVSETTAIFYVHARPVFQIGVEDSEAAGRASLQAYADEIAASMRAAARKEEQRRTIATRVLGASSVIFLGFLAWLLLGVVGQVAARVAQWIEEDTKVVRGLRLKRVEILPASAMREGLRLGVYVALWLTRLGLIYTWVLAVLSLFPSTRPLAGKATGFLFAPAIELLARLATRLPLVIAIILALLVVLLVVRFISLYTRGIERREIASTWVRPETARTTGRLVSVGIALGSMLFVTPLLSGALDGPFPRLGLLGFLAIALGATPIITSCLLGMRMVYGRIWHLGDFAEYGGEQGFLEGIGLFDVRLRTSDGAVVRVPHLMSLWRPTRIYQSDAYESSPVSSLSTQRENSVPPPPSAPTQPSSVAPSAPRSVPPSAPRSSTPPPSVTPSRPPTRDEDE